MTSCRCTCERMAACRGCAALRCAVPRQCHNPVQRRAASVWFLTAQRMVPLPSAGLTRPFARRHRSWRQTIACRRCLVRTCSGGLILVGFGDVGRSAWGNGAWRMVPSLSILPLCLSRMPLPPVQPAGQVPARLPLADHRAVQERQQVRQQTQMQAQNACGTALCFVAITCLAHPPLPSSSCLSPAGTRTQTPPALGTAWCGAARSGCCTRRTSRRQVGGWDAAVYGPRQRHPLPPSRPATMGAPERLELTPCPCAPCRGAAQRRRRRRRLPAQPGRGVYAVLRAQAVGGLHPRRVHPERGRAAVCAGECALQKRHGGPLEAAREGLAHVRPPL